MSAYRWGMVGLVPVALLVLAVPGDLRTIWIVVGTVLYAALLSQTLQAPPRRTLSDDRTRAR